MWHVPARMVAYYAGASTDLLAAFHYTLSCSIDVLYRWTFQAFYVHRSSKYFELGGVYRIVQFLPFCLFLEEEVQAVQYIFVCDLY